MRKGRYCYLMKPPGKTEFVASGVEESFSVEGNAVSCCRSVPDGTTIELKAMCLPGSAMEVASFSCCISRGEASVKASFTKKLETMCWSRGAEEGEMELPPETVIYPLGFRFFSGPVIKAIAANDGELTVFTAKVTGIDDESVFTPAFDRRVAAVHESERIAVTNGQSYEATRYTVTGGPYQDASFWIDNATGTMVKYFFHQGDMEWLIELDAEVP